MQIKRGSPGLLHVVLGFVEIIVPLRDLLIGRPVTIGRPDGNVVTQRRIAKPDLFQPFLAIDRMLECHDYIVVVKWRHIVEHGQRAVLIAVGIEHLDPRSFCQATCSRRRGGCDYVELIGHQPVFSSASIRDEQRFNRIEVGPTSLPIVRITNSQRTDTGIE